MAINTADENVDLESMTVTQTQDIDDPDQCFYYNDDGNEKYVLNVLAYENTGDISTEGQPNIEADDVVDQWMRHPITYNDYLF